MDNGVTQISIHALLAESDGERVVFATGDKISIHALLAESDLAMPVTVICNVSNFYPRSPCGERRYIRSNTPNFTGISIHALLAESDASHLSKLNTP